jgi:predicted nucleic acid-binding protein
MRPHRVREPSQSAWGTAGILAGLASRLGGYQAGQERRLLNDALLFLQALEEGQIVLTRNIGDFDILNQLVPEGRILLYARS